MGILRIIFRALTAGPKRSYDPKLSRKKIRVVSVKTGTKLDRLPVFPPTGVLEGRCYVIDGDTIVIKRTKIRLAGIDAPELDQPWGQKAKWKMVEICKGQIIIAKLNGERSHDRLVATCYRSDGRDIGAEIIKTGLALDWSRFSGGKYRHLEPMGVRDKLRRIHRL